MRKQGRYHATRLRPETAGLELALHHVSGWPVLSITGSPQTLELTLVNRMPHPVSTTALAELKLQFRPGILTRLDGIALAPQSEAAWSLSLLPADARGNLTLQLKVVEPFQLAQGEAAAIRIDGVSADAAGGSRATRVQARYQGFVLDETGADVAGSRLLQLPVLRRHEPVGIAATTLRTDSTAQAGPFLAGLLDGPDLLNDGRSENRLWLRIVNASARPVALTADGDAATRFVLSFTTGTADAAWGLRGTPADHVGLEVPSGPALQDAWARRGTAVGAAALAQPQDPPLQAAWQVDNHTLRCVEPLVWKPREWLDVVLTVYTSARIGDAQLTVSFENLPPYDDGDLVLLARLGPLAARPDAVTVATPMRLRQELDVAGDLRLEGSLRMGANAIHQTPAEFRVGGELGTYYPVVFEDLAWADGEFRLEIFRALTHTDQATNDPVWRGSMMLRIACHSNHFGNGSGYWSLALDQSQRRFVAGFENYPYAPLHVIWLAGDTTYNWLSNHPGRLVEPGQLGKPGVVVLGQETTQLSYSPRPSPEPAFDTLHLSLSQGKIDGIDRDTAPVPRGAILMWSGNGTNIPFGWRLCNGENGTPDLRGRFIVGAGSGSYRNDGKDGEAFDFPEPPRQPSDPAQGQTGGLLRVELSESELPGHLHTGSLPALDEIDLGAIAMSEVWGKSAQKVLALGPVVTVNFQTYSTGGGSSHENLPPYYVLCYIMKT